MQQLYKSSDKKFLGVAAGVAEYFGLDRSLLRAVWAVFSLVLPPFFMIYLILGIVLPNSPYLGPVEAGAPPYRPEGFGPGGSGPARRLTKSRHRTLAGVAGGLGEFLAIDPVIVRVLFLASIFLGGVGGMVYLILALLMPGPDYYQDPYPPR